MPHLSAPCLRGHFQHLRFLAERRITGNGVKPPELLAGVRIIGRDITAQAEISRRVAYKYLSFAHPRRAGDAVAGAAVTGFNVPDGSSHFCIDSDQPAVTGADNHFSVPYRHAPVPAGHPGTGHT